jgi:hypothetical protein
MINRRRTTIDTGQPLRRVWQAAANALLGATQEIIVAHAAKREPVSASKFSDSGGLNKESRHICHILPLTEKNIRGRKAIELTLKKKNYKIKWHFRLI